MVLVKNNHAVLILSDSCVALIWLQTVGHLLTHCGYDIWYWGCKIGCVTNTRFPSCTMQSYMKSRPLHAFYYGMLLSCYGMLLTAFRGTLCVITYLLCSLLVILSIMTPMAGGSSQETNSSTGLPCITHLLACL